MPFVGKPIATRPEADCKKSYVFLESHRALSQLSAKVYAEKKSKKLVLPPPVLDGKRAVVPVRRSLIHGNGWRGLFYGRKMALAGMHVVVLMGRNDNKQKDASMLMEHRSPKKQRSAVYYKHHHPPAALLRAERPNSYYDLNSLKSVKSAADFAIKLAKESTTKN